MFRRSRKAVATALRDLRNTEHTCIRDRRVSPVHMYLHIYTSVHVKQRHRLFEKRRGWSRYCWLYFKTTFIFSRTRGKVQDSLSVGSAKILTHMSLALIREEEEENPSREHPYCPEITSVCWDVNTLRGLCIHCSLGSRKPVKDYHGPRAVKL